MYDILLIFRANGFTIFLNHFDSINEKYCMKHSSLKAKCYHAIYQKNFEKFKITNGYKNLKRVENFENCITSNSFLFKWQRVW